MLILYHFMLSFVSQASSHPYNEMFAWDFTFIRKQRLEKTNLQVKEKLICEKC